MRIQYLTLLLCALSASLDAQDLPTGASQPPTDSERPFRRDRQTEVRPPLEIPRLENTTPLPPNPESMSPQLWERILREQRLPREESSEFQKFVYISSGRLLPIFGSDLFRSVPSTFSPVDQAPVSADYVLGPGDEVILRGWGQVDINYRVKVDRFGNVYVPKVGNINLAGVKYNDLQPYMKNQLQRVFRNFELAVTLGELRSIQIFVLGMARRPGTYTVSSLSSMINALFISGGPSTKGSLRRIQLKRNNEVVTELDLYDLVLRGNRLSDRTLLPGDVIFIPTVGEVVAVTGSVGAPAIYEIKGEETLGDILAFAGGLSQSAAGKVASVEHILDRSVRSVEQYPLNGEGLKRRLSGGDLVTVHPLSLRFDNAVTLRGNVALPGRFPWRQGMKIRDLIPDRESLMTRDYWIKKAQLSRESDPAEKALLTDMRRAEGLSDAQIRVPAEAAAIAAGTTTDPDRATTGGNVAGEQARARDTAVENFGSLVADEERSKAKMNLAERGEAKKSGRFRNDIKRIAPDINWDYAVVQRLRSEDLTTQLLPFSLSRALGDMNDENNLALLPGDVVTVFSQADIKVSVAKQPKFVRLEGEFNSSGVYEVAAGESLADLIRRVGGLTGGAYLFGAEFTRESTRKSQQERLDEFVNRLELEVERMASRRAQNVLNVEEASGLRERVESQRRLVTRMKELRATGRIVLGLKPWDDEVTDLPDFPLEDGDTISVPPRPAVVNVVGAVFNDSSFFFRPERSVNYYLRLAGGGTKDADRSRVFVVRADGSVASGATGVGWFKGGISGEHIIPGDTIVVPEQLDKTSILKGLKDWSQVLAQFAIGAAAIRSLSRD